MDALEVFGALLDAIESQRTREQKIAVLRCFSRGLQGLLPLPDDALMLNDEVNRGIADGIDKRFGFR